jgi:hypothetical protein
VQCLTQTELSQFGTSGDFPEAYVTVDSTPTDRLVFFYYIMKKRI